MALLSRHKESSFKLADLSKRLKIANQDAYREMRETVQALKDEGLVTADAHGRVQYSARKKKESRKPPSNRLTGRISVTRRGLGFVTVEGMDEDIMIPPKFMKTALHGDLVAVVPLARQGTGRRKEMRVEAEVVEIIERARTTVVGTLTEGRSFSFVVPDDQRISRDIYVSRKEGVEAKHGDKVVVELLPWEDEHLNPEGTIVEVLGKSGDVRVEVISVARSFNLPLQFPPDVEREAAKLTDSIPAEEIRTRMDFRNTPCFTIDPVDAKDFDDAISFEVLPGGKARLGVHIADVSHYVKEGSKLDAEAFQRGTSVYMVNEVIPMLPEHLSNNLCSLRPDVDRLTFSVIMDVDRDGSVGKYKIGKSIIHSARRFTYEEVQKIIEDRRGEFIEIILPLFDLTRTLLAVRKRLGSIDFDTGEAKFEFDEGGLPSRIIKKTRLDAHRLVEECMLLANKTVAEEIGRQKDEAQMKPFIYRVHDSPDPSRLTDLANFVKQFGYSFEIRKGASSLALQRLLDKVRGSDVENVINEVALRSMAKAIYSEKNVGHYGLGFAHYTHFTSPIRRYPDLVVHRVLQEYAHGLTARRREEIAERLPVICRQSSERERVAMLAERESVKVMQVEYMKRHVGDEFDGVISGVTDFGVFVEINDLLVQGLIRVRDLQDDYYLFDEKHYAIRGRSRGKVYRLGDAIRVKVVAVHPEEREIDFIITDA